MITEAQYDGGKKTAKYSILIWTAIYALLFFPLLAGVLCLSLIAYEELPIWLAIFQITMFFCVLFSLPISIYFMWVNYLSGRYKWTHFFWIFPFIVTSVECIFEGLARMLFRY